MNQPSQQQCKNTAYRQAFERLDEALEKNSEPLTNERIQAIRRALFGQLPEDLAQGDTSVLPEK